PEEKRQRGEQRHAEDGGYAPQQPGWSPAGAVLPEPDEIKGDEEDGDLLEGEGEVEAKQGQQGPAAQEREGDDQEKDGDGVEVDQVVEVQHPVANEPEGQDDEAQEMAPLPGEQDRQPEAGRQMKDEEDGLPESNPAFIVEQPRSLGEGREQVKEGEVGRIFIVLEQVALEHTLVGVLAFAEAQPFQPGIVDVVADAVHAPGEAVQRGAGKQEQQYQDHPDDGSCLRRHGNPYGAGNRAPGRLTSQLRQGPDRKGAHALEFGRYGAEGKPFVWQPVQVA